MTRAIPLTTMATYRVREACRHEETHLLLGLVSCAFEPGEIEARSEAEEFALERLAQLGLCERVTTRRRRADTGEDG